MEKDNFDFVDSLVKQAYKSVKAPACPNFAAIKSTDAAEEKKGFWSNMWNKITAKKQDLVDGLQELSSDALDGVCAAGSKKSSDVKQEKNISEEEDLR